MSAYLKLLLIFVVSLHLGTAAHSSALQCLELFNDNDLLKKSTARTKPVTVDLESMDALGHAAMSVDLTNQTIDWMTPNARRILTLFIPVDQINSGKIPSLLLNHFIQNGSRANSGGVLPPFVIGTRDFKLIFRVKRGTAEKILVTVELFDIEIAFDLISTHLGLTGREAEVAYWVSQGKDNKSVALLLEISDLTVRKHIEHILPKCGVENRTALATKISEIFNTHHSLTSKKYNLSATASNFPTVADAIYFLKDQFQLTLQQAEMAYWWSLGKSTGEIMSIMNLNVTTYFLRKEGLLQKIKQSDSENAVVLVGIQISRFLRDASIPVGTRPEPSREEQLVPPLEEGARGKYTQWSVQQRDVMLQLEQLAQAHGLSPRQAEVAYLVASGETNLKISETLQISFSSVGVALSGVFKKLQTNDRKVVLEKIRQTLSLEVAVDRSDRYSTKFNEEPNAVTIGDLIIKNWPELKKIEAEVFYWAARGSSNDEIATIVEFGPTAVKAKLTRIFSAVGVANRAKLAESLQEILPKNLRSQFAWSYSDRVMAIVGAKVALGQIQRQWPTLGNFEAEVFYWQIIKHRLFQLPQTMGTTAARIDEAQKAIATAVKGKSLHENIAIGQHFLAAQTGSSGAKAIFSQTLSQEPAKMEMAQMLIQRFNLTPYQAEVMYWTLREKKPKDIIQIVSPALSSLDPSYKQIAERLGVENRAQAIRVIQEKLNETEAEHFRMAKAQAASAELASSLKIPVYFEARISALIKAFDLNKQQAEILFWMVSGKTNQEMAALFKVEESTINLRLSKIYDILQVKNQTQALMVCLKIFPRQEVGEKFKNLFYSPRALGNPKVMAFINSLHEKHSLEPLYSELVAWIILGMENKEIREIMDLETREVINRVWMLYKKFKIRDRTELANIVLRDMNPAISQGLFDEARHQGWIP